MKNILKKIQDMECTGINLGGCQWRIRRISSLDMLRQGERLLAATPIPDEDRVEMACINEMPAGQERTERLNAFQQRKTQEQLGRITEIIQWQEAVLIEGVVGIAEVGETSDNENHWQVASFVRGDAAPFKEGDATVEIPFRALSLSDRGVLAQAIIDHSNGGKEAMERIARFRGGS